MGHNAEASPAEIEEHLDVEYPKSKDELINAARDNNAPDDVMSVLDRIPDRQYGSAADLAKGIGEAE